MAATDGMVKGVDFVAVQTKDLDARGGVLRRDARAAALGARARSAASPSSRPATSRSASWTRPRWAWSTTASLGPVALHVDDVARARGQLEAAGVPFRGDVLDTGVCHMAFFHDPDGNALMLHHRYAPRHTDL